LVEQCESARTDQAGDFAEAAEEIAAALRELDDRGGIRDVFGRVPLDRKRRWRRARLARARSLRSGEA
jgi:hypothetical protein